MLSYQHGYHAGNFADVIKHATLMALLDYMTKKDSPLLYLETHAGAGMYDLHSAQALKTGEARDGIEKICDKKTHLPEILANYVDKIKLLNKGDETRYYPGSPWLAIDILRLQDRVYCCELHPNEYKKLQQLNTNNKRVFFSNSDGLDALKSLLPPPERRGLVFIDPSFEIKNEYQSVPEAIKSAYSRFSTGVYCLWYPLIDDKKFHAQLVRGMNNIGSQNHLQFEFSLNCPTTLGMHGCGLWIINPPYILEPLLKNMKEALTQIFKN